mgnify:CR=1 FL=1
MELIIKLVYAIFITQLWISSTPMIMLRNYFGLGEDALWSSKFRNFLVELANCALCSGFWIAIILLSLPLNYFIHFIGTASIASVLSELLFKNLNNK